MADENVISLDSRRTEPTGDPKDLGYLAEMKAKQRVYLAEHHGKEGGWGSENEYDWSEIEVPAGNHVGENLPIDMTSMLKK